MAPVACSLWHFQREKATCWLDSTQDAAIGWARDVGASKLLLNVADGTGLKACCTGVC